MKNILRYLVFSFALFLFISNVNAAEIKEINMDIYIDKIGNAHISETWKTRIKKGTEGYRYYGNLGNSKIIDYDVFSDLGDYTNMYNDNTWDVNASFEEKAYKYGINKNGSYNELCFGISKYGNNTYTLNYTITNFVSETEDSQILYWELIPKKMDVKKVNIKIYSDFKYSDTLEVWGYGNYGGIARVKNGYIEMSNKRLKENEYMTLLVKFDKGTFDTSNNIGKNFNYYYEMAEENSVDYNENKTFRYIYPKILMGLVILVSLVLIIVIIKDSSQKSLSKTIHPVFDFGSKGDKIPNDVELFRELPCGKDIYRAYWVASNYHLVKKETDFLGTILLKWIKQGKIRVESKIVGIIFKRQKYIMIFTKDSVLDNELENELYNYIYTASKDGILEKKEFVKWCRRNYSKILKWFDKVIEHENDKLIDGGKLFFKEKTTVRSIEFHTYKVDESMYQEAIYMKGLKQFFNEFENMKDKEAIEVTLWEEYLMYAQIFGVADKVAKQFKELYPDVITDQTYNSMVFVNNVSRTGMASAASAKSRAESYSSGGGGFSSGGGGGGSFGGGGGGGFR